MFINIIRVMDMDVDVNIDIDIDTIIYTDMYTDMDIQRFLNVEYWI